MQTKPWGLCIFYNIGRVLTIGAALGFFGISGAAAITLDFETDGAGASLDGGTFISDEWENLGISLRSTNGALRLFNSNCGPGFPGVRCTGGDSDLASGARFGRAGFVPAQGNVLIRQDRSNSEPDDTARPGMIRFDFEKQVRLTEISLLDNDNGDGITLKIFKNGSAAPSSTFLRPSVDFDNYFQSFAFAGDVTQVTALEVIFPGSGAIASLGLSAVPLPPALPLLLMALAGLAVLARRR